MKEKVVIGMSGGVDSSVSALLLKNEGYEVTGLFMRNWDSSLNNDILGNPTEGMICPQEQDFVDAKKVAEQIGIPLVRIDFIEEYWNDVFNYFLDEYKRGRTPNPDILCNKYIKFGYFLDHALQELHADKIAMGHYAQVRFNKEKKKYELIRGIDANKDQTYFLCQLTQHQLSKVLFPIGHLEKPEVRRLAKDANLFTAAKKDSTGICFIGERHFQEFLQNYIPNQPGNVIDIETNCVIGKHIGVMYYTIGQRKGLNLGGMEAPYYVVGKSVAENVLFVATNADEHWLYSDACLVDQINWIGDVESTFTCTVKFRYRQVDIPVTVVRQGPTQAIVHYPQKAKAVTPGQEAVFYLDDVCLGGGVINTLYRNGKPLTYL